MNNVYKRELDYFYMKHLVIKEKFKLLILMIIGILIGIGLSTVGKTGYVEIYQTNGNASASDYEEAIADLGESQISITEAAYNSYREMVKQRDDLQEYLNNSIYLNTDSMNGQGRRVVYIINGGSKSIALSEAINSLLVNKNLYNAVNNKLEKKLSFAIFSQLINVSCSNENKNNSSDKSVVDENSNSVTMTIDIYGRSLDECNLILKSVNQRFNSLVNQLKKVSSLTVDKVGETTTSVSNYNLNNSKSNFASQLANISQSISSLKGTLSQSESNYFDFLTKTNGKKPTKIKVFSRAAFIKPVIALAIILPLFYLIVILCRYIFNNRLHTYHEIEKIFNVKVLRVSSFDNQNVLLEEMRHLSESRDGKIGIVSSFFKDEKNNLDQLIDESLKEHFIIFNGIPKSEIDFEQLDNINSIVIIEKINQSSINDIQEVLDYYKGKDIAIDGAILFR